MDNAAMAIIPTMDTATSSMVTPRSRDGADTDPLQPNRSRFFLRMAGAFIADLAVNQIVLTQMGRTQIVLPQNSQLRLRNSDNAPSVLVHFNRCGANQGGWRAGGA